MAVLTCRLQVVLDIYHPHICLFIDVCQVFICLRFSIYKFIDLETYFRIWNTLKIGTYRGIRKTRVIYIDDYLNDKFISLKMIGSFLTTMNIEDVKSIPYHLLYWCILFLSLMFSFVSRLVW